MAAQGEMHFQFRPQTHQIIFKSPFLFPQLVQCTDYDRDKRSLQRENEDAPKVSWFKEEDFDIEMESHLFIPQIG